MLDEPLSALDANLRLQMQAELRRLHAELGITFLYVTHSQSEAFAMADRVAILADGRVQQIGTAQEVYRAPANRFVAQFVGAYGILDGRVATCGRVETPVGMLAAGTGHAAGTQVSYLVPADRVSLSETPIGAENEILAEVATEEFSGAVVTVILRLANGSEIKVQQQQSALASLSLTPGGRVYASWPAEAGYILPNGDDEA